VVGRAMIAPTFALPESHRDTRFEN